MQSTLRRVFATTFATALAALGTLCSLALGSQAVQATETIIYLHNDVSGTPMAATDSAGNLLWKESYKPYGERTVNAPGSATGKGSNQVYFHGKKVEDLNGGVHLSYFGARYYDPSIGRFMGVDPQGFDPNSIHSFNRYAYGNNNPYKYVDPDGHSPLDIAFLVWDIGKLGVSVYKGAGVGHALADVGLSLVGVVSPIPGAGQALKIARAADHAVEAGKVAHAAQSVARGTAGGERAGKAMTRAGKTEVKAENAAQHGGQTTCSHCGQPTIPAKQSQSGVTPPGNETHVDHIIPKSKGGDGSPSNGQVLCRDCNLKKSDN